MTSLRSPDIIPDYVPAHLHDAYRAIVLENQRPRVHSSYWLDPMWFTRIARARELNSIEYPIMLAEVRRGVANFVRILTRRAIPVRFSSGVQSFATPEDVVVIAAPRDPEHLDSVVGTSLHEAAHIIKSKYSATEPESIPLFDVLKLLEFKTLHLPQKLHTHAERLNRNLWEDLHLVINVLEDRRIDDWVYETVAGYRPYYDARYAHKWKSPRIADALVHPMGRRPLVPCYQLHFINMINPLASPELLDGMDEIHALVDLPNIRRFGFDDRWKTEITGATGYLTFPEMLQTAAKILAVMYEHSVRKDELPTFSGPDDGTASSDRSPVVDLDKDGEEFKPDDDYDPVMLQHDPLPPTTDPADPDPDNLDTASAGESPEEGGVAEDDGDEEDEDFNKSAGGYESGSSTGTSTGGLTNEDIELMTAPPEATPDEGIPVSDETAEEVDIVESAHAELVDVGGDIGYLTRVTVVHRVTPEIIKSSFFGMKASGGFLGNTIGETDAAVTRGLALGASLVNRLRVMADESELVSTRLNAGRLDKRRLAAAGFGDEAIFKQTHIDHYNPVFLHLSVDASTSMRGEKWIAAFGLATALAYVGVKLPVIDVTISLRADPTDPVVAIIFDSRRDSLDTIRSIFPLLGPGGGTPEGLCFEAILDEIIQAAPDRTKYFVNISDGMPETTVMGRDGNNHLYRGETAYKHTAQQVKALERNGIAVMSYFVGTATAPNVEQAFKKMYGTSAQFVNPNAVADIARTLNRLFLVR